MTPCPHPVVTLCPCSDSLSTHQDQDLYQDPDLRPAANRERQSGFSVDWLWRERDRRDTLTLNLFPAAPTGATIPVLGWFDGEVIRLKLLIFLVAQLSTCNLRTILRTMRQ